MSVAGHLRIRLDEYDARIRTFIPYYEEMIDAGAQALRALDRAAPHVVDLGTGTGALAAACARVVPHLSITAVDSDGDILEMARSRLQPLGVTPSFVHGSFMDVPLPVCDAVVSSFALHHIGDPVAKQRFFHTLHDAIAANGLLVLVDCHPSSDASRARLEMDAWRDHLLRAYSAAEADALFAAWAEEDTYAPLDRELDMIRAAGLAPDVIWRRDAFAVIAARR